MNIRRKIKNADSNSKLWKSLILFVISLLSSATMIIGTTPDRAGPLGITLLFVFIFIGFLSGGLVIRSVLFNNPSSNSLLLVILISVSLITLLALNTIQLSRGDIVLAVIFVSLFMLYWVKLRQ